MAAWDSVISANVRYAENLTIQEKFLFAEISACTGELGYCKAKNSYFARICKVDERSVRRWLEDLQDGGYIDVKFIQNKRRIYLVRNFKKDFTPLEKTMMKYKTPNEIVSKIKKRLTNDYPMWEVTPSSAKSILYTLANFYFEPEAYTKTLANELISFELLEILIEVIDLKRIGAINQKLKNELGEIENSTLYIMTAIINNHSKEVANFRDLQKRHLSLTFDQIANLYHQKKLEEK